MLLLVEMLGLPMQILAVQILCLTILLVDHGVVKTAPLVIEAAHFSVFGEFVASLGTPEPLDLDQLLLKVGQCC